MEFPTNSAATCTSMPEVRFLRDWRENPPRFLSFRNLAVSVLLTGLYLIGGKLGLRLALYNASATPVWPDSALTFAAFLLLGYRVWPGILIGAFLVNITTAGTAATSLGIAIGNTAEGLLGAYLVNRFAGGVRVFHSAQTIFRFLAFAGLLSTAVSATVGVTTLSIGGFAKWEEFWPIWLTWWTGDSMGTLVLAPALVLMWNKPTFPKWDRRKVLEAAVLGVSLLAVGIVVSDQPLKFLCVPFLIWAAFSFGELEASLAVLVLAGSILLSTVRGNTFLAGMAPNQELLVMQSFLGVVSVMTVTLAAIVSGRRQVEEELRSARDRLRGQVAIDAIALQDLAGRLIHAQEEERSRIGRELHDHVSQRLGLLAITVDELRTDPAIPLPNLNQRLEELSQQINGVTEDIHRLSHRLHSSTLDYLGLVPALHNLVAEFSDRHGIAVGLVLDSVPEQLPSESTLCLFRVVEEGLNNIAKHSGARSAQVTLNGSTEGIRVTIADAGAGFDLNRLEGNAGLGFVSIRERLRLIQGDFRIESSPAYGTRIEVWVPHESGTENARATPIAPGEPNVTAAEAATDKELLHRSSRPERESTLASSAD